MRKFSQTGLPRRVLPRSTVQFVNYIHSEQCTACPRGKYDNPAGSGKRAFPKYFTLGNKIAQLSCSQAKYLEGREWE